jgi:hypothetical protein
MAEDRVLAFVAEVARRRAAQVEERKVFARRRTAGLKVRHRAKAARTR